VRGRTTYEEESPGPHLAFTEVVRQNLIGTGRTHPASLVDGISAGALAESVAPVMMRRAATRNVALDGLGIMDG
jgi:hypothetical protein